MQDEFFHVPVETKYFIEKDLSSGPLFKMWIGLRSDATEIKRKTGTLFDLLGICGGLMRALTIITTVAINPYTLYVLESHLALNLVRLVPSTSSKLQKESDKQERKLVR